MEIKKVKCQFCEHEAYNLSNHYFSIHNIRKPHYEGLPCRYKGNKGKQNTKEIINKTNKTKKEKFKNIKNRINILKAQGNIELNQLRGKKISDWYKKNRGTEKEKERRKKLSIAAKKQWARGNGGYHPNKLVANNKSRRTWIENMMAIQLENNNIDFKEGQRVGKYFPDFILPKKIIVECDGAKWHEDKEYDRKRDEFLESEGYKVLRFTGQEIRNNLLDCIEKIEEMIISV